MKQRNFVTIRGYLTNYKLYGIISDIFANLRGGSMVYLSDILSFDVLKEIGDHLHDKRIYITSCTPREMKRMLHRNKWKSHVFLPSKAEWLSNLLGIKIEASKEYIDIDKLSDGDVISVPEYVQYAGHKPVLVFFCANVSKK